ncbi:MAG: hypothetical protein H6636_11110 [Anaerolineales bacterium]|nr:hypothetical protein [Anaerolineales bacterium]
MDAPSRLVTKTSRHLKIAIPLALGFVILALVFQTGRARETSLPASNFNSPETSLRGIEFNPLAFLTPGTPDAYGYQWDDAVPYAWKDTTGGNTVFLTSADDGYAGPISLGFNFPFYENTYSEIYVSANGYISFDSIEGFAGRDAVNKDIPSDTLPNNFIAPFWNDLAVGGGFNSGVISTKSGSDANGTFLAVNYLNVSKRNTTSDLLSFQILLYANGDVWFQYQTLAGDLSATVGIEDGDALDGSQYALPLTNNLAIRFERPPAMARIKLLSTLQSALTQSNLHEFSLQIRNTGELGSDTYELTSLDEGLGNPNWTISLSNEQGAALTDTNGDGNKDTGAVSQGETITILVRLTAPSGASVGDFTSFKLFATSDLDSNQTDEVRFLTAIPSRHMTAFGNSAGLDMGRVTKDRQIVFDVTDFGDFPSLIVSGKAYFNVWEDADFNPGTDIEYAIMDYYGKYIEAPTKLTTNANSSYLVRDYSPFLALSKDDRVGVVWVRRLIDPMNPGQGENYNLFWAILDTRGNVILPPTNITNNGPCESDPTICWQNGQNDNVPIFNSPVIIVTSDNRFVISWIDSRLFAPDVATQISYAIFDTNGNPLRSISTLKAGTAGGNQYEGLHLTELFNERMIVAYTIYTPLTGQFTPALDVYSTSSTDPTPAIQTDILMNGTHGRNLITQPMNSSKILMAWTNTDTEQIEYTILSDNGSQVSTNNLYTSLPNPDERGSNFVSAATNGDEQCILSWVDTEKGNRVYYALIGANGNIITPAMIAWEDNEPIVVSQTGQGIVYIPDWLIGLPVIKR